MSFFPKIDVEYDIDSKSFIVTETTDSWGGTNPERGDTHLAKLIVYYNDKKSHVYNVTSEVTGETLLNYTIHEGKVDKDGLYKIFLLIHIDDMDPNNEYWSEGNFIGVSTELESHINKFWAKYACMTNLERKRGLEELCVWLEANLAGLHSLGVVLPAKYNEVLSLMQRRVDLNKSFLL